MVNVSDYKRTEFLVALVAGEMAVFELLMCVVITLAECSTPVIVTTTGHLRGDRQTLSGVSYYVYKGVPYAEPPVGGLRWRVPDPKSPWDGVFNATRFGKSCTQDISGVAKFYPEHVVQIPPEAREVSEDCLTLNIYTPADAGNSTRGPLAVMFFVHGGSSLTGQGSGYDGSALAVRGGIVVVTINYRLNVFGYLGTGDENAPGNFGLLDQQLALKWVHDNIAAFGGDPNRVTLIGQSAGGLDVSLHLFANASRPLFKRIASHSGPTSNSFLAPRNYGRELFFKIGRELGCESPDSLELVACLRNKPADDVFSTQRRLTYDVNPLPIFFLPVIDDVFVSSAVARQDLTHDLLFLHTSGDGSVILEIAARDLFPGSFNGSQSQFDTVIGLFPYDNVTRLAIGREYTDSSAPDPELNRMKGLVEFMLDGEWLKIIPAIINTQPGLSSLRWGIFDHRSSVDRRYPGITLAPHSEELPYVFGLPFSMTSSFTDDERRLSDKVIRYWSNFAKSGDPNVNPDLNATAQSSDLTYWPEYGDSQTYLLIQLNESTVGQGYRKDKVAFWTDYLPRLSQAAAESCSAANPSTSPSSTTAGPDCGDFFIGKGLGLKLTKEAAETLIEVFIFLVIALLVALVISCGASWGFRYRYKEGKKLKDTGSLQPTNGTITQTAVFEVNEGFTNEAEDTKM